MKLYEKDDHALIGLCGKKGSGKTTVANILVNNFGFQYRHAFASPLKKMVEALCIEAGVNRPEKEKPIDIFGGKTMREIYQTIGTEWGRNLIDDDLWVKILNYNLVNEFKYWELQQAAKCGQPSYYNAIYGYDRAPKGCRVVIEDVRFPNEVTYVTKHPLLVGNILQVVNPRVVDNEFSDHESEKQLANLIPDEVIDNDGSIEILVEELKHILPREWYFQEGD